MLKGWSLCSRPCENLVFTQHTLIRVKMLSLCICAASVINVRFMLWTFRALIKWINCLFVVLLFYNESTHDRVWLQFLSIHCAVLPVSLDILMVTPLLLCPLMSIPFFLETFQTGINCHCLFDPNQLFIRFVLLFSNFLDLSKNIAEECQ